MRVSRNTAGESRRHRTLKRWMAAAQNRSGSSEAFLRVGGKSASLFSVGRANAYESREPSSRAGALRLFISSRGNQS